MANVGFYNTSQEKIEGILKSQKSNNFNNNITEGSFYLTEKNKLYIGRKNTSDNILIEPINAGITPVDTFNTLQTLSGETGEFYYIESDNILCVRSGNSWVQINAIVTNAKVEHSTTAVTDGTALSTSIHDSRGGDPVTGTFNVIGSNGITVSGSDATITVAGDPITVTTVAENNVATTTIASASKATDGKFAIAGGDNVTITAENDTITVAATDTYVKSFQVRNKADNGFEIYGLDNSGNEVQAATFQPTLSLKANDETATSVKFENGVATLPVYTAGQVDGIKNSLLTKLETDLRTFNAMEYKGTVGSEGQDSEWKPGLPTVDNLVKNGYAYLVAGELAYNDFTYSAGTLIVASGAEDATTGYITGDIEWTFVTGSATDTTYKGNVQSDGVLALMPSTGGDAVASINVTQGTDIVVSATGAEGGKNQIYNVAHTTYEGTDYDTAGAVTVTDMVPAEVFTVEAITGITVTNGHITGVTSKKYEIIDTNTTLASTTAVVTSAENSNLATITHETILKDGSNNEIKAAPAEFTIASSSLAVGTNIAGNGVVMNLVWGTF